ncbi:hypothetical protein N656DRAFT_797311 [Canariomyces notabilis]|uniref:Uncharacterized protein n=1 Tax=Canariomyces notabilis TaxID=2074819 RepID=A0AAN6TFC2_9PEZI|nr:hypothetical protein N656DRAFT_797311 [Canariomyces arenarius]
MSGRATSETAGSETTDSSGEHSECDSGQLRRTPTVSSFYDLKGTPWDDRKPNSQTWIYAREVRAQAADVLAAPRKAHENHPCYPSVFRNDEGLELKAEPPLLHTPVRPGHTTGWLHEGPRDRNRPGAARLVYSKNPTDTNFDVVYHDKSQPQSNRGYRLFAMAEYVPAATSPPSPARSEP